MEDKKEVEIDLSKLFSFFKRKSKKGQKKDSEFDFSRLEFLKQPWVITLILIIIPFLLAFSVRMIPADLPITDQWAESSVYSNVRNQLANDIQAQNPNLPDQQKAELLDQTFDQYVAENQEAIDGSIEATSVHFKSRLKNENGYTYLLAIDPYQFYRRANNILETGHPYDTLKDGTPWNDHMVAPIGRRMGFNLHPYIIAANHKILSIFGIKDLMGTAFFLPILLSALAVIPAFLLGKRFAGNVGGFVGATFVAVASPFISRTAGGFVDTDAYNVIFPLLIAWLFIEAMEREKLVSKIVCAALSAASLAVYALIWEWWFIFDLILMVIIGFFIFNLLKSLIAKKGLKLEKWAINNIYSSLTFIIVTGLLVGLFKGFVEVVRGPFARPFTVYYYKAVATFKLWPNVMTTVAEQNALTVPKVINTMGGPLMFFAALLGLYLIAFNFKKHTKRDTYYLIGGGIWLFIFSLFIQPQNALIFNIFILIPFALRYFELLRKQDRVSIEFSILGLFWFMIAFFASVRGVRFTLLLVPIFGLGYGVAIGKLFIYLTEVFHKTLNLDRKWAKTILTVGVILVLLPPFIDGRETAMHEIPSMNDAWYQTLTKIRNESSSDAIINSWWDFGHWFKAIGDRGVTFDGASQDTPMAHWIGLSLLSNDEQLTVGILRMLDCGSNTAFEVLNDELNNEPKSVELLYEIIVLDKEEAKALLESKGVTPGTAEKVLEYTHCEPPEDYYIVSDDMIGKSGVWAHFGSWDFNKASMYRDVSSSKKDAAISLLQTKYNMSSDDAMRIYYEIQSTDANNWIAPWPSFASNAVNCQTVSENKLICVHSLGNNNMLPFEINLTTKEAYISTQSGRVYPNRFVYVDGDTYGDKAPSGELIGIALALIPPNSPGSTHRSVLLDQTLALSTFNKLFYYKGFGMHCFELFNEQTQLSGGKIYTYKVDWSCSQ